MLLIYFKYFHREYCKKILLIGKLCYVILDQQNGAISMMSMNQLSIAFLILKALENTARFKNCQEED